MGVSAALLAGAGAWGAGATAATALGVAGLGLSAATALETKDARKDAERQAAKEREALAALQQEPEPVMPVPDDKAMRDARRRSISSQMRRRGRASTLLSESGGDGLGG